MEPRTLIGPLLATAATVIAGCSSDRILTGEEIRALFADKTVHGYQIVEEYHFRSYEKTGRPAIIMHGRGQELFTRLKLDTIHISISHDKNYAIAQAIAEK